MSAFLGNIEKFKTANWAISNNGIILNAVITPMGINRPYQIGSHSRTISWLIRCHSSQNIPEYVLGCFHVLILFFVDFNKMYELYDPCTVMFFFRNKHIMIDLGTGNNNKINWAMEDKQVGYKKFLLRLSSLTSWLLIYCSLLPDELGFTNLN